MDYIFTSKDRVCEIKNKIRTDEKLKKALTDLAESYLLKGPFSVTFHKSPAISGDIHDYFSEGLYWWPDPENPDGPYIRRDGEANPDVFKFHRSDMHEMCKTVLVLAQAGLYLEDDKYFDRASELLKIWFIDEETKMNPHLTYAQAIRGVCSGRGIGIIDTEFFVSVINALNIMEVNNKHPEIMEPLKKWFSDYTNWLNTSENGLEEKNYFNNHSNWWNTQVASFCAFTGDEKLLLECFDSFKNRILPSQIDNLGRFTDEITRTLSYTYTIYNLTACVILCEIAHFRGIDLYNYTTENGKSVKKAVEYLLPFYEDFSLWEYQQIKTAGCENEKLPLRIADYRLNIEKLTEINENKRKKAVPFTQITQLGVLDLV